MHPVEDSRSDPVYQYKIFIDNKSQELVQIEFTTDRNKAAKRLNNIANSLLKIAPTISEKDSIKEKKIIEVARENYWTSKAVFDNQFKKLADKRSESIWAKFKYFLASKKIYFGDLYNLNKAMRNFYKTSLFIQEQGFLKDPFFKKFYKSVSNSEEISQIIDKLINASWELETDESALVFLPDCNEEQDLRVIIITNDTKGKVVQNEKRLKYLGRNEEGEPRFVIKGVLEETEVTGVEELKKALTNESDPKKIRSFNDVVTSHRNAMDKIYW